MVHPRPFCYAKALGKLVVRNHTIWMATGALAILFCVFLFYPMSTGFTIEPFQNALDSVHQSQARNADAPEYIQEEERLVASQLEDVIASFGTTEFAESMAVYYQTVSELMKTAFEEGRTDETADGILHGEGTAQLYTNIAQLANPVFYNRSTDFPLTYYLLYMLTGLPFFVWYIPFFIIVGICARECQNGKLLSHAPIGQPLLILNLFALLFFASLLCTLASWLPAALWTLFNNGFGDPSYPVSFLTNGKLFSLTIGDALLEWMAIFATESALLSLVAAICLSLNAARIAQTITVISLALPFIPGYLTGTIPQFLLKYLPSTFLDETRFLGKPGTAVCIIESGPDCTFWTGLTTITGWSIAAIVIAALACLIVHFMHIVRNGERHA